jgi:hypothetical protein
VSGRSEGDLHFYNTHTAMTNIRMLPIVPAILRRKLNFELPAFECEIIENRRETMDSLVSQTN